MWFLVVLTWSWVWEAGCELSVQGEWAEVLDGTDWTVENANGSVKVAGTVPGTVHTDLHRAGVIGDPFWRFNDVMQAWVKLDNWTYTRHFSLSAQQAGASEVLLVLEGLQTLAEVTVNGEVAVSANNMFRRWVVSVGSMLRPAGENNTLSIAFHSSAHLDRTIVRTEQDSYGWDWSPSFLPQGPWRSVYLLGCPTACITDLATHILSHPANPLTPLTDTANSFNVSVTVYVTAAAPVDAEITLSGNWSLANCTERVSLVAGNNSAVVWMRAENVKLWWPNGYGGQTLHSLSVVVRKGGGGQTIASAFRRVGFRSLALVHNHSAPHLFFRINGVPIFAKGANFVPSDCFEERITEDKLRNLLTSVRDAHQNLLRVWGGGVYMKNSFYELADELGVMIWQEFIFSDACYPADDVFLGNVWAEAQDQVRRLSSHSSVVLWCGNNEISPGNCNYSAEWTKLFVTTLLETAAWEDPTKAVWPSSPSYGIGEGVTEGGLPDGKPLKLYDWRDILDFSWESHFYSVFVAVKPGGAMLPCPDSVLGIEGPAATYPNTAFISEFGYVSLPSFKVLSDVTEPGDWGLLTPAMVHRENSGFVNTDIAELVDLYFPGAPVNRTGEAELRRIIYLSQLIQGRCVRAGVEHFRRGRDGLSHTMGSLYWMLDAIWPAPSWDSLEYGGRWKILHHMAREFNAPLALSVWGDGSGIVAAHIASDLTHPTNGTAEISVVHYSDAHRAVLSRTPVVVPPLSGVELMRLPIEPIMRGGDCDNPWNCFLDVQFLDERGDALCSSRQFWLTRLYRAVLPAARVTVTVLGMHGTREARVRVSSDAVCLHVTLTSPIWGRFDRNAITVLPDGPVEWVFFGWEDFDQPSFTSSLHADGVNAASVWVDGVS